MPFRKVDYFEYYEPAVSLKEKAAQKELVAKLVDGICNTRKEIRAHSYFTLTDLSTGDIVFLGRN